MHIRFPLEQDRIQCEDGGKSTSGRVTLDVYVDPNPLCDQQCTKTSTQNACGQTTKATGKYNCSGQCIGSPPNPPPPPSYYQKTCTKTSVTNTCGDTDTQTGTFDCNNVCDAQNPVKPVCIYGNVYKEMSIPPNSTKESSDTNFAGIDLLLSDGTLQKQMRQESICFIKCHPTDNMPFRFGLCL